MIDEEKRVALGEKSLLVSETDLNGIFRYINDDLSLISGYSEAELIGKPHDIMRHPSMPRSVFQEMRSVVEGGRIWKGFVKNMTKSGDCFWVFMTVFPIDSVNGEGYLAVRTKASDEEIARYEAKYERALIKETQ
ncbi:MAG: PAS domain-containing protein [Helicobacteraceae bacterium]|jgi:aerotaxis receptor|nr:PAS domain-containing protein [Helicobacteraceae bacterium]